MTVRQILSAAAVATLALAAGAGGPLAAQGPTIAVEQLSCMRTADNQVVHAATAGEPGGSSARLYFRWLDPHGDKYWVELEHDGPGKYWATPPKPESHTTQVEYYGVLVDAAGAEVVRSAVRTAKVTSDCKVQLTPQQYGAAQT